MMEAVGSFYFIYIDRLSTVALADVEKKMDKAIDWYRLAEETWIVYTTVDAERWYARLSPFAKEEGRLFICKLDQDARQGWMTKKFWDWLEREKSPVGEQVDD